MAICECSDRNFSQPVCKSHPTWKTVRMFEYLSCVIQNYFYYITTQLYKYWLAQRKRDLTDITLCIDTCGRIMSPRFVLTLRVRNFPKGSLCQLDLACLLWFNWRRPPCNQVTCLSNIWTKRVWSTYKWCYVHGRFNWSINTLFLTWNFT